MNQNKRQKIKEKGIETKKRRKPIYQKLDAFKKELKRFATPAEKHFKKCLVKYKIKHKFQKAFLCDTFQCIVDFFIGTAGINICVEIDGGYHTSEYQKRKDEYRSDWLRRYRGCKIIRFTNEDVFENVEYCIYLIADLFIKNSKCMASNNYKIFSDILLNYKQNDNTEKRNQPIL